MDLIKHKNIYFIISAIVIIPGLISLFMYGLNYGIDFTGGSLMEISASNVPTSEINNVFKQDGVNVQSIKKSGNNLIVRSEPITQGQHSKVLASFKEKYKDIREKSFETVGPTIGKETEINALKAVLVASIAITLYIAFTFRSVSRPVSSWKFGICAIIALLHDVLVVVGVFSILGKFAGVEVDSLFITALLTVMGFSVHDTIVVFDRIRENLKKNYNLPFEKVVNNSILETLNRSLNTSFTVVIALFALLLFGGASIHWFVVALLVGIISGTYSSIFNASPLLVVWYEWDKRGLKVKS